MLVFESLFKPPRSFGHLPHSFVSMCPLFYSAADTWQVPLAMECLSDAPETDAGPDNEEGGPNHLLIISDCNGRCEFVSFSLHS